jgi:hypothetical protein
MTQQDEDDQNDDDQDDDMDYDYPSSPLHTEFGIWTSADKIGQGADEAVLLGLKDGARRAETSKARQSQARSLDSKKTRQAADKQQKLAAKQAKRAAVDYKKEQTQKARQEKKDAKEAAKKEKEAVKNQKQSKKKKKRTKSCTSPKPRKKKDSKKTESAPPTPPAPAVATLANPPVYNLPPRPDTPRKKKIKTKKTRKDFHEGTDVAVIDTCGHAGGPVVWGVIVERTLNHPPTFMVQFPEGTFDYEITEIYTCGDEALRDAYDLYGLGNAGCASPVI